MITVKECRKILKENGYEGIEDMTDERIVELRDFLYHLAKLQIEDEEKGWRNLPIHEQHPGTSFS